MSTRLDHVLARTGQQQSRDLSQMPFSRAERLFHSGEIPEEDWLRYCYEWVTSAPRFSDVGLREARQYARTHGLPDPRPNEEPEPGRTVDDDMDQLFDREYPVDDNVPDLGKLRRGRSNRLDAVLDRLSPRPSTLVLESTAGQRHHLWAGPGGLRMGTSLDRAIERFALSDGAGPDDDPMGFKSKVSEFKAWVDAAEADLKAAGFAYTQGMSTAAVGHAEEILREVARAATNLADLMATHKQQSTGPGTGNDPLDSAGPGGADDAALPDDSGGGSGVGPYTGQPLDSPSVGAPLPGT